MIIDEICHINIVVSDMDRSLQFYRDLLGLSVKIDKHIGSPNFSKGAGLENVKARIVMLKANTENTLIELFQYDQPKSPNIGTNPTNTIPLSHIAFKVKDVRTYYNALKSKGVEFIAEPQMLTDGVWFCYFRDPDGALLELIEFPEDS